VNNMSNIEDRIYLWNHVDHMVSKLITYQFDFNNGDMDIESMKMAVRNEIDVIIDVMDNM